MTVTRVAESRTEFKLKSLPEDVISSVKFAPKSNQFLLVSSWDCSVRLYDVSGNLERHKYNHELPVLDVCFRVRNLHGIFIYSYLNKTDRKSISMSHQTYSYNDKNNYNLTLENSGSSYSPLQPQSGRSRRRL